MDNLHYPAIKDKTTHTEKNIINFGLRSRKGDGTQKVFIINKCHCGLLWISPCLPFIFYSSSQSFLVETDQAKLYGVLLSPMTAHLVFILASSPPTPTYGPLGRFQHTPLVPDGNRLLKCSCLCLPRKPTLLQSPAGYAR